jgi:UDP-N-acetyl-D-glucosamine dehydrogenase
MESLSQRNLVVIGQGYVGLPLAMAAVDAGWTVVGLDNSEKRVEALNEGKSPVEDISDANLKEAIKNNKYKASTDFKNIAHAEVVTICVPTPLNDLREPDLSALQNATLSAAPFLKNGTLLVSESTSYPGTLREVVIPLVEANRESGISNLYFAAAPERVNPGDQKWNQKNTPRLVGGIDHKSQEIAMSFYSSISDEPVSVSSPEVAEAAKLLENTFRLVNIGLVNEFAKLCDTAGISVNEVISAAETKPYGFTPFRPGVGVGGHCIPVDPLYLTWWARKMKSSAPMVEIADQTNYEMHKFVATKALSLIKERKAKARILILGVAYKPGVSDIRETPVAYLRDHLKLQGHDVQWVDPFVDTWEGDPPASNFIDFDVAILAVNQPGIDLKQILSQQIPILDCTNSYSNVPGVTSL